MGKINKISISGLWIVIILVTGVSAEMQQISTLDAKKMPQNIDITDACKKDKEFVKSVQSKTSCLGREFSCVDGWRETHYFDGTLFTKDIKSGVDQRLDVMYREEELKELKKATIAIRGASYCNCITPVSYTILHGDKQEEVTCEEFYKFIEEYNTKCNGCVKKVGEGCC